MSSQLPRTPGKGHRPPGFTDPLICLVSQAISALPPDSLFGVACSGGVDSMVLADAVFRTDFSHRCVLLHVDHGVRSQSSKDAQWVEDAAKKWNMAFKTTKLVPQDVSTMPEVPEVSEASLRQGRYQIFDRLRHEYPFSCVFLAHTASDQAETILLRVLQGTSITGIAAMENKREGYQRPLLSVPRRDIERYAQKWGVEHREDGTNRSWNYLRNRIRNHYLPILREENPQLESALIRLGQDAKSIIDCMRQQSVAPNAVVSRLQYQTVLDCLVLKTVPEAMRRRLFADEVTRLGVRPTSKLISSIESMALRDSAGTVKVSAPAISIVREYDSLYLKAATAQDRGHGSRPKHLDSDFPDLCNLEITTLPTSSTPASPIIDNGKISNTPSGLTQRSLTVRRRDPGDRMRPVRLQGKHRKLSDLYIDAKIPSRLRKTALVVQDTLSGDILWAEYLGTAYGSNIVVSKVPKCNQTAKYVPKS